jgi:hypothetical protein
VNTLVVEVLRDVMTGVPLSKCLVGFSLKAAETPGRGVDAEQWGDDFNTTGINTTATGNTPSVIDGGIRTSMKCALSPKGSP